MKANRHAVSCVDRREVRAVLLNEPQSKRFGVEADCSERRRGTRILCDDGRDLSARSPMPARRVGEHAAILRLITTQSALVIASGIACGAAASWLGARQVRSLLFDLDPADAETMFLAVGVVLVATALAAVLPARRASRVNPAITLR
jgi:hypothetical protein